MQRTGNSNPISNQLISCSICNWSQCPSSIMFKHMGPIIVQGKPVQYHGCHWPGDLSQCCNIGESLSSIKNDFDYLCYSNVDQWCQKQIFMALQIYSKWRANLLSTSFLQDVGGYLHELDSLHIRHPMANTFMASLHQMNLQPTAQIWSIICWP